MRAGDILLAGLITATIALMGLDAMTDGDVSAWLDANLHNIAVRAGRMLSMLGMLGSVLLVIPIGAAIWGQFGSLPTSTETGLRGAIRTIDAINTTIADMARWFALALVVVTATVVVQRYVFGIASTKLQESVIYFHALLFLLSAASTLLADGHVRVDIIYAKLSPRAKAWTELAGIYLALIPMGWLILDVSGPYIAASWRILEQSRESDGLPLIFLLKTAIPVFAAMLILQGASMAARAALTISGTTPPALAKHTDQEL